LSSLNQQEFIKVSQDSRGTHTIQKFISLASTLEQEEYLL